MEIRYRLVVAICLFSLSAGARDFHDAGSDSTQDSEYYRADDEELIDDSQPTKDPRAEKKDLVLKHLDASYGLRKTARDLKGAPMNAQAKLLEAARENEQAQLFHESLSAIPSEKRADLLDLDLRIKKSNRAILSALADLLATKKIKIEDNPELQKFLLGQGIRIEADSVAQTRTILEFIMQQNLFVIAPLQKDLTQAEKEEASDRIAKKSKSYKKNKKKWGGSSEGESNEASVFALPEDAFEVPSPHTFGSGDGGVVN